MTRAIVAAVAIGLFVTPGPAADGVTIDDRSPEAFGRPVPALPRAELRRFAFGNRLFKASWTVAPASVPSLDGLGPLYNRASCSGCHVRDGRGRLPESPDEPLRSALVRVVTTDDTPHPRYGHQLQNRAIPGATAEAALSIEWEPFEHVGADGTRHRLRRPRAVASELAYGPLDDAELSIIVAPSIFGLGLLEAVEEATILEWADEDDADGDGISGRANRVGNRIGRFGWKASVVDVRRQTAIALARDMGITSSGEPVDDRTARQPIDLPDGGDPEISDAHLDTLTFYTRVLAVPAGRGADEPQVERGAVVFESIGCASCHRPELTTGRHPTVDVLSHRTIRPFSDLLLHDMGPGLAGGGRRSVATAREWRTPPLWGLGLQQTVNGHTMLLHDGRARGVVEAVLWHGGEAERARRRFERLSASDRDALVSFVESR